MDSKIKNNIKMSLEAKRLLQKQLLILPIISNSIQKVGVKNYRKNDHWAWYVFPTTKLVHQTQLKLHYVMRQMRIYY